MSERLKQDAAVDEPGLVGARWWQDSVVDPVGRRSVILGLLAAGTAVGLTAVVVESCKPDTKDGRMRSIDLQRKYGWSFGAATENLVFNGVSTEPYDPSRLNWMTAELSPRVAAHKPFYVSTLFESPTAMPTATTPGDPTPIPPLKNALKPIFTSTMRDILAIAQAMGQALAQIPGVAVVVDLDGQDSVAFAAGASQWLDPVFLFDNWPHPHGVVAAHMTLAAAAYFQPMLAKAAQAGSGVAPPLFVLDRQRLAAYRDDATQFDNRWIAKMPSPSALKGLGVKQIVYVTPTSHSPYELDDLNDDLVSDAKAGVAITVLDGLSSLDARNPPAAPTLVAYAPVLRKTPYSLGPGPYFVRQTGSDFGTVPVVLAASTGALLGVVWSRSGTWNRSSGGWGG